jgi:Zn-dependent peptidase ImmA (M78 family)
LIREMGLLGSNPTPLLPICAELGCLVVRRDLGGVDGLFVPVGCPTIFLNERHAKTRRRFTLAHEIGHIILGHYEMAHAEPVMERHADIFAAELLMPIQEFRRVAPIMDDDGISEYFGVSLRAAQIRREVLSCPGGGVIAF